MTILVEDTARNNLASWTETALSQSLVDGAIISPFSTPRIGNRYKQNGVRTVRRIQDAGGAVWFDPTTHALQMSGVGDFRYYDDWDLWGSNRGALSTAAEQREHARRVFSVQTDLGVPHLAPTILLHTPESDSSQRSLDLARIAIDMDPGCRISIAGTAPFWASESSLDAHIGALAQLAPAGWFLTCVRPVSVLPVPMQPADVFGLARTARSLADFGPVHISFGDLAALPAVAAGATSVGTGWAVSQRVCAYPNYSQRDPEATGGGWFRKPTIEGLLSFLTRPEAERLQTQAPELARSLVPGTLHPHVPEDAFLHHARSLSRLIAEIQAGGDKPEAYQALRRIYETAAGHYPAARSACACNADASEWIDPFLSGLVLYGRSEGWN